MGVWGIGSREMSYTGITDIEDLDQVEDHAPELSKE